MSKKSHFRGSFEMLHGKQAETLSKSKRQHLYHIYWSLWRQFSWKKSLLVICKILGLFLNTLTADHKYSLLLRDNLSNIFKSNYLGNNRHFREFFLYLGNLDSILKNFKKEVTLIADVFLNLSTPKKVVR